MIQIKRGKWWNCNTLHLSVYGDVTTAIPAEDLKNVIIHLNRVYNDIYHKNMKKVSTERNDAWEGKDQGVLPPEVTLGIWAERNALRHPKKTPRKRRRMQGKRKRGK